MSVTPQGHREKHLGKKDPVPCKPLPTPTTTTTTTTPTVVGRAATAKESTDCSAFHFLEWRAAEGSFTFEYFGFSNCIFGASDPRPRRLHTPPFSLVAAVGFKLKGRARPFDSHSSSFSSSTSFFLVFRLPRPCCLQASGPPEVEREM